jgi:uncharacterized protein with HEPN domain
LVAPPANFEGSQAVVKKDPRVYLAHILECARKIERYTSSGEKEFLTDTMLQDAVIRNFEIIGEAAKRVPETYRRTHSKIPWRLMAGFRDVLIHAYEGVDLKRVWRIVRHDLPVVKEAIEKILPPLEELEKELAEPDSDKQKSKK